MAAAFVYFCLPELGAHDLESSHADLRQPASASSRSTRCSRAVSRRASRTPGTSRSASDRPSPRPSVVRPRPRPSSVTTRRRTSSSRRSSTTRRPRSKSDGPAVHLLSLQSCACGMTVYKCRADHLRFRPAASRVRSISGLQYGQNHSPCDVSGFSRPAAHLGLAFEADACSDQSSRSGASAHTATVSKEPTQVARTSKWNHS